MTLRVPSTLLKLCPRCCHYLNTPPALSNISRHSQQLRHISSTINTFAKKYEGAYKEPQKWALHDKKMSFIGTMTTKEARQYIKSNFKKLELIKTDSLTEEGEPIATMREQTTVIRMGGNITDHDLQIKVKAMKRKCEKGQIVQIEVDRVREIDGKIKQKIREALKEHADVLSFKELGNGYVELRPLKSSDTPV